MDLGRRVVATDDECWLWQGRVDSDGYAQMLLNGRAVLVHRLVYRIFNGPLNSLLEIDHLCRVRACINPAHLEPVSHRENVRRGLSFCAENARKTHCKHGHPFDEANTRFSYSKTGALRRTCRTCSNAWSENYKKRKRAQAAQHDWQFTKETA